MAAKIPNGCQKVIIFYKLVIKLSVWVFSNKMFISIYNNAEQFIINMCLMLLSNMAIIIQNGGPEMFQGSYLSGYSTDNGNFCQ